MQAKFSAQPSLDLKSCFSVSQLVQQAKQLLEQQMLNLWVEGEISNFTASSAGHWYFTLKDAQAQIACVMFAGRNALVVRQPTDGDRVTLKASASIFAGRGQFQLQVTSLNFAGVGNLLAQLEALKNKLAAEGLFATEKKLPLPAYVETLGVITSLQGAALKDVLHVLARRWPLARVLIYPAVVQGKDAAASLRRALALAQYYGKAEALLLVRGGGSLEDLNAFNDETLARMVAASPIPVITGVGHETDFTLVDFCADLRAPTPSAAAENAVPNQADLQFKLERLQQGLASSLNSCLNASQQRLDYTQQKLHSGLTSLRQQQERLGYLQRHLANLHPQKQLRLQTRQLQNLQARLAAATPLNLLQQKQEHLATQHTKLAKLNKHKLQLARLNLANLSSRLANLSPLHTLSRGYALAQTQQQKVITQAAQVEPGAQIKVWLGKGALDCQVTATYPQLNKLET